VGKIKYSWVSSLSLSMCVCVGGGVVNCLRPPVGGLSFSSKYGEGIIHIQHKRLKLTKIGGYHLVLSSLVRGI
jgi:hypothetical protein